MSLVTLIVNAKLTVIFIVCNLYQEIMLK